MCSTSEAGRHWDGTPVAGHRPRTLRIAPTSPSRLLRCAQTARCRHCGNPIEWYYRTDGRPLSFHPAELAAAAVPARCRWHIASGIAHPGGDNTAWCRLPHLLLCPGREAAASLPRALTDLRRRLAVHTRRLTDTQAFTPPPAQPPSRPARTATGCRPTRPVVQLLYLRYLARHPIEGIPCVALTRSRRRCPHRILAPTIRQGTWRLLPTVPGSAQLPLPDATMAIYDLTDAPYAEQLRWRAQRCPQHTATTAADAAVTDWEVFHPHIHHQHIHPRLPAPARHTRRM